MRFLEGLPSIDVCPEIVLRGSTERPACTAVVWKGLPLCLLWDHFCEAFGCCYPHGALRVHRELRVWSLCQVELEGWTPTMPSVLWVIRLSGRLGQC